MDLLKAMVLAIASGNDKELRKIPEGREVLLKLALERRKEPLYIRRFPRVAGQALKRSIDEMVLEVIHEQENRQIQEDPDW